MPIEHWIALVSSIPSIEGIMGQDQPNAIPNVLLLVVLYLHKLISEIVVIEELIVVVAQYQVLLPLQVLQYAYGGLGVVAGHIAQYEHMISRLYYGIPIM